MAMQKPPGNCSPWSMMSFAVWPRGRWLMKLPDIRSNPPPWSTKPGCGWAAMTPRPFKIARISSAMRRILIEHARRRLAAKRGAGAEVVDLDGLEISSPIADDDQLLAVNDALEKLATLDPRKAELVKLRYFVGLNFEETAAALNIAVPTAKQWWAYTRAWLTVEMRRSAPR